MTGLDTKFKKVNITYQYGCQDSKLPKKYKILRKMTKTQKLSNKSINSFNNGYFDWAEI